MNDHLTLKWGTLKSWDFENSPKAFEAFKKYSELGMSMGAAQQHDTPEQKELICQMIDEVDCKKIYLDWDGKYVTKKQAKKYVMEYGRKENIKSLPAPKKKPKKS